MFQVYTPSTESGLESETCWLVSRRNTCSLGSFILWLRRHEHKVDYATVHTAYPIPETFFFECLKHKRSLEDEHTKIVYPLSISIVVRQVEISLLQSCPNYLFRFLSENRSAPTEPEQHWKRARTDFSDKDVIVFLQRITWKQRGIILAYEKTFSS